MMILFLLVPFLHAHVLVVNQKPDFIQQSQITECAQGDNLVQCLASLPGVLSVNYRISSQANSLTIQPRKPVAYWGAGLVDQSGQWFQVPWADNEHPLPSLDVQEPDLYEAIALLGRFSSRQWSVKFVEKTAGGQWQVKLKSGPLLYLGSRPSERMSSLEQFFKIHPEALQAKKQYYDFRNPVMVASGRQ
jgi:hypothetical protein